MLLAAHEAPVVSLTVVTPGPVKTSEIIERVFRTGLGEVMAVLDAHAWVVAEADEVHEETGPEWLASVAADPEELKRALVALEDAHPWGRLWDVDVVTSAGPLSRSEFGLASRRCLVCGAPAHACARSRRHSLAELAAAVEEIVARG